MRGLETVQSRHADVQQEDIRFQLPGFLYRFAAISRFPANGKPGFRCKQLPQPQAHEFMIVGYENPNLPVSRME
jgi:hypothetical protein